MPDGQTALHCASDIRHLAIVVLLLATGANPDVLDIRGRMPLYMAAQAGRFESVEALIAVTIGINTQTYTGHTALSIAAPKGHHATVQALLNAGAEIVSQEPGPHSYVVDPEERLEMYGEDALSVAYISHHRSVFRLHLELEAEREPNEFLERLELWDKSGNTASKTSQDWLERRITRSDTPEIEALKNKVDARLNQALKEGEVRFARELGILDLSDEPSCGSVTESAGFRS